MEEDEGAESWLLEINAFEGQQVSVKFAQEHYAHQLAEDWIVAQRQVERIADTMRRSGRDFAVS